MIEPVERLIDRLCGSLALIIRRRTGAGSRSQREDIVSLPEALLEHAYDLRRTTGFTVTDDHLKLLSELEIDYDDVTEFGTPEVDPKRPYGNSDVYLDIAEAIGMAADELGDDGYRDFSEKQFTELHRLHLETTVALQILTANLGIAPGLYRKNKLYDDISWQPVQPDGPVSA